MYLLWAEIKMVNQTIQEKIKQRRRQMLVHSYLYYEKNENIVSDSKWSQWAMELVQLQKDYPKEAEEVEFAEMFSDWDGSSGAFLKYSDNIKSIAERLYSRKLAVKKSVKNPSTSKKSNTRRLF